MSQTPKIWISFDVDYLGGSYGENDREYSCVKDCEDCYKLQGRPKTQVLSLKEKNRGLLDIAYDSPILEESG